VTTKPLHETRFPSQFRAQHLQRDTPVKHQIQAEEYGAHPAFPDLVENFEIAYH
jgi:hypothetical protein